MEAASVVALLSITPSDYHRPVAHRNIGLLKSRPVSGLTICSVYTLRGAEAFPC